MNEGKRVYIAGPYSAATVDGVDSNIAVARDALAKLFREGYTPFCPHTMTAAFDRDYPDIDYSIYINTDLVWLKCCDFIYLLPGWEQSQGSLVELLAALEQGVRILNPAEVIRGIRRLQDA